MELAMNEVKVPKMGWFAAALVIAAFAWLVLTHPFGQGSFVQVSPGVWQLTSANGQKIDVASDPRLDVTQR